MATFKKALQDEVLPYGLALFVLGAAILAAMALSLSDDDVSYARTVATALTALCLGAVAIVLFATGKTDDPACGRWWRAFWTAGFVAYLFHFWWAVFRTYNGDFGAVLERQTWAAYVNFATTAIWAADIVAAWIRFKIQPLIPRRLHEFAWLLVTASFIFAAVGRSGLVMYFGYALALVVAAMLIWRFRHWSASTATTVDEPDIFPSHA